jgi:lactoylglutathione lyase
LELWPTEIVVAAIVYVEDVAASLAFYEGVLGVERDHLDDDGSYGELKSGIGFAASWHAERHLGLPFRRSERDGIAFGFELDFAVDDVDAVFRRAVEAGADPVSEPQEKPWGRAAMFRDPDGVLVHISRA